MIRNWFVGSVVVLATLMRAYGQDGAAPSGPVQLPNPVAKTVAPTPADVRFPPPPTLLEQESRPIDLASSLQLAGVQNPQIMLARERIVEAAALRQLAAAQILPTLNAGTNLDAHVGALQQSNGTIINVNRDSLYLGLGAAAVGAGTVNIPGVVWSGNVSTQIFQSLASKQVVRQREFASQAIQNEVLLRVAQAYLDLLRAVGRRAIANKNREEALEVARITANFAAKGQGRQADADRAATELEQRNNELLQSENDILAASARLAQLLSLNSSERLQPIDGWVVPSPIVPDPIPLPELVAIALMQRPELKERQAAIRAALLELQNSKVLPFSPNYIVGYSAGGFGGGSNLATEATGQARFTNLQDRQDFDAIVYWSLRNLGVGNVAMIRLSQSNLRQNEFRNVEALNAVRAEVVLAFARTHVRYAQIDTNEKAVQAASKAYAQDYTRTKNREGLPIEVLDSMRLLGRSRYSYLDAIVDYNRAHFDLYVALGQPPADMLARPVPSNLVPAPAVTLAPPK